MENQRQPMTPERLAEIEARANAATPGPWEWNDEWNSWGGNRMKPQDGEFIVAARQDIPDLLARVRELEAENADLRARIDKAIEVGEKALKTSESKSTGNPILDSAIASSMID